VLVWRLDRWGRSVTDLLATLQELEHLGVGFVSLTEALDLTTPAGRAMAGLLAVFADYAEGAIMQSPGAEEPERPACHRCRTLHNTGWNRGDAPGDWNRPSVAALPTALSHLFVRTNFTVS
jgi:hypothetical protein